MHHFDNGNVTIEPTCNTDGKYIKTCLDCDYEVVSIIKCYGHQYSEAWMHDKVHHWTICERCGETSSKATHSWDEGVTLSEPTTSSQGTIAHTCTICGDTKTNTLAKLPSEKTGCSGSIVSSICGVFTLTGALIFAKKKRKK